MTDRVRPHLIVNADDFGMNESVNDGIIACVEAGSVTSVSCMTNMPAWPRAAEFLRSGSEVGAGVHLVFNEGTPMCDPRRVPSLVGNEGTFLSDDRIRTNFSPGLARDLRREFRGQIERFRSDTKREPTHLDNHCPISYLRPVAFRTTLRLAHEYDLPVRLPFGENWHSEAAHVSSKYGIPLFVTRWFGGWLRNLTRRRDIRHPDIFVSRFSSDAGRSVDTLERIVNELRPGAVTELLTHPGYNQSWKLRELEALTDDRFQTAVRERDVRLVTFSTLASHHQR